MEPGAIGPFRIKGELGRGGMGEVYLAQDTRLDRQVAIKVLPAHLAQDQDRLARFQREAKVLASLNHPGIGAIYGLEEAAGRQYLILEFVEGETLAERLSNGALPVDECLLIARQIAEALEAAHEKGIIHRDLKPGNVMVTSEGAVKVLDFGLARTDDGAAPASTTSLANSPTVTSPARFAHSPTIPGVIMGTAGYMSPEQARGKPVDKRSDIFSFGCVLYEMLSGEMPFRGETVADSIGATLHKETDFASLPAGTPRRVRDRLASCLAKDRRNRLHDIGDARLELDRAISEPGDVAGARTARGSRIPLAVACVIAIAGGTFPWWSGRLAKTMGFDGERVAPRQVVRFTIEPPSGYTLPEFVSTGVGLAISPGGDRIVYAVEADHTSYLCEREVAGGGSHLLPNSEQCINPFFSPDGKWLGFVCKGRLMKMPAEGGPALSICEVTQFSSFAWLDDGSIVWGAGASGIWRVRSDGGGPVQLVKAGRDAGQPGRGASALGFDVPVNVPGSDFFLCCSWDGPTTEDFNVMAVSLSDGSVRPVLRTAAEPRLIARDRLLFTRGTTVMTVGFDPVKGVVVGEPTVALEGVRTDQWQDSAYIAASPSGAFAYVAGGRFGSGKKLVRVEQTGKANPILDTTDNYNSLPAVSPDGRRAVLTTLRTKIEMWVLDLEHRSMSLVSSSGEHYGPTWSRDGASIVAQYVSADGSSAIARWPAGGGGPAMLSNTSSAENSIVPLQELSDGTGLLVQTQEAGVASKPDISIYDYAKATLVPVRNRPASEGDACISPDGTLIAYVSDESGRWEVQLGPLGAPGPNVQVSNGGGGRPRFSPDGKKLFFLDFNDSVLAAAIEMRDGAPSVSAPSKLFDGKSLNLQSGARGGFSVLPDGSFIMIEKAAWEKEPPVIHMILNWADELNARTASR